MELDNIVIVLCRPDESRNIGSVCRSMMTMGLHRLRIVGNRNDYDDEHVRVLAIHAASLWDSAEFFTSLTDAVTDCAFAAGTTRRKGKKRKEWAMTPEEFSRFAQQSINGGVAVVFGNERTGLTDDELKICNCAVSIPSSNEFPSLNLSHAVQIIAYQLFRTFSKRSYGYEPVSLEQVNKTVGVIIETMKTVGFFSRGDDVHAVNFFSSMLARAALSKKEIWYFEYILAKTDALFKKQQLLSHESEVSISESSKNQKN